MSENHSYNGWKNYETWNVALWIDNDQGSYNEARDITRSLGDKDAPHKLADGLKDWIGEMAPDLGASLFSDLLGAALSEVDWFEIAKHYIEDVLDDEEDAQ